MTNYSFTGTQRNEFTRRLVDDWQVLATELNIPQHYQSTWPSGKEGLAILSWLEARGQLRNLPAALIRIDRQDLAAIFCGDPENSAELSNLSDVLCALFPTDQAIRQVLDNTDLPIAKIDSGLNARASWTQIVREFARENQVKSLIESAARLYPGNLALKDAADGNLTDVIGPSITNTSDWRTNSDFTTYEKIMGRESTILPISFLEIGLSQSKSVARIVRADGATGTGFLIDKNYLITNNHVLEDKQTATNAVVQFNFQSTPTGLDINPTPFGLDPEAGFITSVEHDFTVVKLDGDANYKWGAVKLSEKGIQSGERVIIIQHPGGGGKAISLYHNVVTFSDDNRVQYLTDTQPGSSGSPVFDNNWEVVAVHHSGGWLREPGSKRLVFRNEGIAISQVLNAINHV